MSDGNLEYRFNEITQLVQQHRQAADALLSPAQKFPDSIDAGAPSEAMAFILGVLLRDSYVAATASDAIADLAHQAMQNMQTLDATLVDEFSRFTVE